MKTAALFLLAARFAFGQAAPLTFFNNLLLNPTDETAFGWDQGSVALTANVADPDGGTTATRLTATGASAYNRQQITVPPSTAYTLQVTFRKVTGDWFFMGLSDYVASAFQGWCNAGTGTAGIANAVGSATFTSFTCTSAAGWQTATLTGLSGTNGGTYYFDQRAVNANGSVSGTAGNSIDVWHPQLFAGSSTFPFGATRAGKKYSYYGFIGDPANRYRAAQSDDGITWNGYNGVWSSPAQINAPQVFLFGGNTYLEVAKASDGDLLQFLWFVAILDPAGAASVIATVDWSGQLPGLATCFSGGAIFDAGVQKIMMPCSIGDRFHSLPYLTQMVGGNPAVWSNPQLVTTDLSTGSYDYKPFLIGGKYYMWSTQVEAGGIDLSVSNSLAGPYTKVTTPSIAAFGTNIEGPTMFSTGPTSWRIAFEQLLTASPPHKMFYSDCNTLLPDACTWTARQPWTEDLLYRHGSIILTPSNGATGTKIQGKVVINGKVVIH